MAFLYDFTSDGVTQAMLDGLYRMIRKNMRERILEAIQPEIDQAIEAACETFEASVHAMVSPSRMETVIKVIIEDKRKD